MQHTPAKERLEVDGKVFHFIHPTQLKSIDVAIGMWLYRHGLPLGYQSLAYLPS